MSWNHVKGHDARIRAFSQIARQRRLAHAYLFTGPAGIGKRLFALELAKALLCENPPSGELVACDECPACKLVDAGNHPDLHIAARPEDKTEFTIAVMREVGQSFALKSSRGRAKVVIIDDADDMNDEAANCFLKTLEEPPPGSHLILIGTSAERQLPTIRSRCQVVTFAPLPADLVKSILLTKELPNAAPLDRIVGLAEGSPGLAMDLADADLWKFREKLLADLFGSSFNPIAVGKHWMTFIEEAGKESSLQRRRAALTLRLLIAFLHDALRIGLEGETTVSPSAESSLLAGFLKRMPDPDHILTLIDRCLDADQQNDRRVQLVLIIEALVDAFCRLRDSVELAR